MTCSKGPRGPIGIWDVSAFKDMNHLFSGDKGSDYVSGAELFNGDISKWNVRAVTTMEKMFYFAKAFKHDLPDWNVGQVTNMKFMFGSATSFD